MKLSPLFAAGLAALALAAAPAAPVGAQEDHVQTNLGGRFRVMELDQPDRDLRVGDRKINVLVDAVTGRSWVLRYDVDPQTNRKAYVWIEIPMLPPAE